VHELFRIFLFLTASLGAGSLLAVLSIHSGISTGWIGAFGLITWSFSARRRWVRLEKQTGTEPGLPERALWIQCAGYGLLLGHLITALLHTKIDLRLGSGNTLAIDSWMMIVAAVATDFIFRRERSIRDERDTAISARGVRASYLALILLSLGLAFCLAYVPPNYRGALTHFVIGNILIALILASYLTQLVVRLHAYANDAIHQSLELGAE